MKRINLSSADRPLAEYAADLRDEIVLFTKRNRAVAAIVPLKNVDRESLALSHHPEFLELIQDPILQRIEGVEVEGPIHLQLFGVMRRQPLDQEVEPTATARRANPCTHERPAFNEAPVPKQSDDLAIGRVLQQTSGCPLLVQPSERRTP